MYKESVKVWAEEAAPFILLTSVLNQPGIGAKVCKILAEKSINVESFMTFSAPGKERVDILIEVSKEDLHTANYLLSEITKDIQAKGLLNPDLYVERLATVVIRGAGLHKRAGVILKVLELFSKHKVNVWSLITTKGIEEDEIKVWIDGRFLSEYPEALEEIKKIV